LAEKIVPYVYHPPTPSELKALRAALRKTGRTESWLGRQLCNRWYPEGQSRSYMHELFVGHITSPDPRRFTMAKAWRLISGGPGPRPEPDRGELWDLQHRQDREMDV
jgi:hypothetical protein